MKVTGIDKFRGAGHGATGGQDEVEEENRASQEKGGCYQNTTKRK